MTNRAALDLSTIVTPGMVGIARLIVAAEHTAPRVGSGEIAVLATPVMISLIEAAALAACEHLLPTGTKTLGTRLDVTHTAATPIGGLVIATARVTAVNGRDIQFSVDARDDVETIGAGTHARVAVDAEKFIARVKRKADTVQAKLGGHVA